MTQTVICMKWGTRYGADYVNRLFSMIQRHTRRPTRLVCYTDDASGINPPIETHPLPHIILPPRKMWRPWRKISLWQKQLDGIIGTVLYIDLDVVITGNLDDFFDFSPGRFCVARNWTQTNATIGNTSVYRFEVGSHSYLYDRMMTHGEEVIETYDNSQTFISREIKDMVFWPDDWCVSFKHCLMPAWPLNFIQTPRLPKETRLVAFTGKPDPDEALAGRYPAPWYKKIYKHVRPTPWIGEHWR